MICYSILQIYRNTPHNPSRRHKQPYRKNGALVSTVETESEKRVTVKRSLWFLCIFYSMVERNAVIGVRSLANCCGGGGGRKLTMHKIKKQLN
jgi:hypothetical protein